MKKSVIVFVSVLFAVASFSAYGQSGTVLMQLDCISVSGIGTELQPMAVTEDIVCFTDNQFFIWTRNSETIEYIDLEKKMMYSVIPSLKKGCMVSIDTLKHKNVDFASVFSGEDMKGMKVKLDSVPSIKTEYGGFKCQKQEMKVSMSGKGMKAKVNVAAWGDPEVPMNEALKDAVSLCSENELFSNASLGRMGIFPNVVKIDTDFNLSAFLIINGFFKTSYTILWYKPEVVYSKAFQFPDDIEFIDRESYVKIMEKHIKSLLEERKKAEGKQEYRITL